MKVGILSEFCLATTHGSGSQLMRIIEAGEINYFHIYWSSLYFGLSDSQHSFKVEDPYLWHLKRYKKLITHIYAIVGYRWWNRNLINKSMFRRLVKENNLECDVIYAYVTNEGVAQRCLSLIEEIKRPFVVHVMDVQHDSGLDPKTMMGFSKLFEKAASVIVLNIPTKEQVEKFPVKNIEVLPIGQVCKPKLNKQKSFRLLQILIAGNIHENGLDQLNEGWECIREKFQKVELLYAGNAFGAFPPRLRSYTKNLGFLRGTEYEKVLSEIHIGFIPGPIHMDCYGRFSIPSRIADFCMAGVPIIACVACGSATEIFLRPMETEFVKLPETTNDLIESFKEWLSNDKTRDAAGKRAREFAEQYLSIDKIADRVVNHLESACVK